GPSVFKVIGEAKFKDVKIAGDNAKGQMTTPSAAGKENTTSAQSILELALSVIERGETFHFKLENGVWKIDLIPTIEEAFRAVSPSPSPQLPPQATRCYSRPRLFCRCFCW